MKLETTELEQIQSAIDKFNQAKIMLGDIELNKQVVLSEIDVIKAEFKVIEDALIEKYGRNLGSGTCSERADGSRLLHCP